MLLGGGGRIGQDWDRKIQEGGMIDSEEEGRERKSAVGEYLLPPRTTRKKAKRGVVR